MAVPALRILMPSAYASRATRFIGSLSRRSARNAPIHLPPYQPLIRPLYQPLTTSANQGRYQRLDWARIIAPMYGYDVLSIPAAPVDVPRDLQFQYPNEGALPYDLPQIYLRATRSPGYYEGVGIQPPPFELVVSRAKPRRRGRPPENTRRFDDKVGYGYRRFLTGINRTLGTASEFAEFTAAFALNLNDPLKAFTALALNQAIDTAYGTRARFLRNEVYSHPAYRLPVGIDALTNRWGVL